MRVRRRAAWRTRSTSFCASDQQFCEQFPIQKHSGGTIAVQRSVVVEGRLSAKRALSRKTRRSTGMGSRKRGWVWIQGWWSGEKSSGGDDTVDMRVEQEVGTPAVQDGDEADLGARRFDSAGDLQ